MKQVFGVLFSAENQALSCLSLVPALPGSLQEQALALTHVALQSSLPPQKQTSARVTCHAGGDPGGNPDLKQIHLLKLLAPEWSYVSACQ